MKRLPGHRFRRTTLLSALYIAFLGGIGLAHAGHLIDPVWVLLSGIITLCAFRRRSLFVLAWILVLGLGLGIWRGALFMEKLAAYQPYYGQKIMITAQAMNDAAYGKNSQISFDANKVRLDDGTELAGKVTLSGFGVNSVYQGDEIQITGKFYPGYGAYQGRISYGQLSLIGHHPSLVADIRRKFAAGMQSALPEPLAPFAMGLLIGQRATLQDNVKQDLLMVGLTHIIAVSGYNLTIMLHASKGLFGKSSKRMATFLSLALIGTFLLLAGSSASIIRAAIVSVLSIAAGYYGRSFRPLNLIMLAAAITAWANPFYVWSDVSWYLSFLAFYGVMALAPAIARRLRSSLRESLVVMVALESICAETMTLPYVLHIFGQMSFIGLPANVLVVTLVPLAMLLSMLAGLAGMLAAPIAGWLAWPARLLLTYMLDIAHLLSRIPHVFIQNIGFSIIQMLFLYCLVMLVAMGLQFKNKTKSVKITEKKEVKLREQAREWSQQMVNN